MAVKSKVVTDLSDADRADLDKRLAQGRQTLDQLVEWLGARGYAISRSSLGRYARDFGEIAEDVRLTREMAAAVGRELEGLSGGDATGVIVESLHSLLLKARKKLIDTDNLEPKEVAALARAVANLSTATARQVGTELRLRREIEAGQRRKLEEAAASGGSLSSEAAAEAMRVLGFAT